MKRVFYQTVFLLLAMFAIWSEGKKDVTNGTEPPLKVVLWEHGPWTRAALPEPQADFVRQKMLKDYNIDFEIQVAPSDGADIKLSSMIAAGQIPDIIEAYWTPGTAIVQQFIQQEILLPIDELIEQQPFLNQYLTEDEWLYLTNEGKKYALAQPRPVSNWYSMWVRQDWLDKFNLQRPETVEDLDKIAKIFTEQDPDGNGINDTYGFTSTVNFGELTSLFAPFGAYPGRNYIRVSNNKVIFDAFSPEMRTALEWWKKQIDEGKVDPNWLTAKKDNWRETVSKGKVGLISAQFQLLRNAESSDTLGNAIESASPSANWVQLPAIKGPFGSYTNWYEGLVDVPFWITRNINSEPQKANKVMSLLNDLFDPETDLYKLAIYGEEGTDYDYDANGDLIKYPRPTDRNWRSYYSVFRLGDLDYFKPSYIKEPKELWSKFQHAISEPKIDNVTGLVRSHENWPDLDIYIQEMHIKFVLGQEPFSNWDKFIETSRKTYGFDEIQQDATEQLKSLNVIK
jgi:putative aldouronate transport system substrate-binding protein